MIINLTPHTITVLAPAAGHGQCDGYCPDGPHEHPVEIEPDPRGPARVTEIVHPAGAVEGIPVVETEFGPVEGLPEPVEGTFYVVHIEAFADPSPPEFSEEDLGRDVKAQIDRLVSEMRDVSGQEAMDQVYRRLTLYLCGPCYRQWIENPTG